MAPSVARNGPRHGAKTATHEGSATSSPAAAAGMPQQRPLALLPDGHRPVLIVLIDAEEEFDWDGGFRREHTGVSAMAHVHRAQEIFDAYGIVPTYVVDFPVASQRQGSEPLAEIAASGRAVIGAHLHPWVTPPFDEEVCPRNSFPGNLPRELEAAKLASTISAIERAFGAPPRVYQAGRYGLGPHTHALLESLGFEVDFSICPPFDYTAEGGPDYSRWTTDPYWFGAERRLLGIPLTGGYTGLLSRAPRGGGSSGAGGLPHGLHTWANRRGNAWARLPGLLSRTGLLDRLRLTPEGFDAGDHRRLVQELLARGRRTFVFSFHTPSLKPGCTPYVRSEAELAEFLDRFRRCFDFFLGELDGLALTPLQLRERLLAPGTGAAA
ncbi:MAG TPA: polysaccharide deacetylase family protein [Planctomycetota bacterium]|nr:polysaccharide deacetylase family protein [Planctomycetota bacterium]